MVSKGSSAGTLAERGADIPDCCRLVLVLGLVYGNLSHGADRCPRILKARWPFSSRELFRLLE